MATTPKKADSGHAPGQAHAAGTVAADGHGGHGGGAFPPFDPSTFAPQLIWLVLTFGALYAILSRAALPKIESVLKERGDRIKRDLTEAERLKSETDAALKSYEQALTNARNNAQSIAKSTRDKLQVEVDAERARVDRDINAKLADTEKRIGDTKARALASVNDIAVDTAGAIVSRLIGKDVPADEIKKALASKAGA